MLKKIFKAAIVLFMVCYAYKIVIAAAILCLVIPAIQGILNKMRVEELDKIVGKLSKFKLVKSYEEGVVTLRTPKTLFDKVFRWILSPHILPKALRSYIENVQEESKVEG